MSVPKKKLPSMDRYKGPSKEIKTDKFGSPVSPVRPPVEETDETTDESDNGTNGTTTNGETKTAGFMGLPTIAWIAIGGIAVYYAYSKGMFKKFLK